MTRDAIDPPNAKDVNGSRFTRRAWWSLLGFLPSFVLAFVIGEGLISALGYPTGGDTDPPWWAVLTATVPALVVFVLPAAFSVHFGRRAIQHGDRRARTPMVTALMIAAGFVLLNGASGLAIWLS
jgi:hypothetical protein